VGEFGWPTGDDIDILRAGMSRDSWWLCCDEIARSETTNYVHAFFPCPQIRH